nr:hypothetical protein [Tanacetum cinerariifolium]
MGRDTIQLENVVSTISQEYLLEFTFEYGITESLHPKLPGPEDPIVEFPEGKPLDPLKNWNNRFFWVDDRVFPTIVDCRTSAPRDQMPPVDMDLFSLISTPNPAKTWKTRLGHQDLQGHCPLTKSGEGNDRQGSPCEQNASQRGPDEAEANVPPKVMRKDHVASHPSQSTLGGKSLADIGRGTGTTISVPATQEVPVHAKGVRDPDSLSYAKPRPALKQDVAQSSRKAVVTEDPDSEKSTSFTSMVRSPGRIYQSGWGVTNTCRLDTLAACQDMVDHIVPTGYFSELHHLPNDEFLNQYNTTLKRKVAIEDPGHGKSHKNLEALLEAEVDVKDIAGDKNVELVSTLQAQVTSEERIKAVFEEFKKYKDDRVSSLCAIIDAILDALSIDLDEELYPHMLTAIAGHVVFVGIAKCMSEGLKHDVEHGRVMVDLAAIEAYDPEADTKYIAALHALKDLNSSQLKIPVYPEVRNPRDPWTFKEEILLEDAITTNISRIEKKNKCRVVCRTHGVGFAHHARSDGVPVSVPTVAPQGLAILLADAAT